MQPGVPYQQHSSLHVLLLAATLLLACAAADQQSQSSSSYIQPQPRVPDFNPAAWNQAFKLTLRNVPAQHSSRDVLQRLRFPKTMLMADQLSQDCSSQGFDTTAPAGVPLGSCFTRAGASPGTSDYWIKLPGLALVHGNCYCYALDMFRGGYCYPGTSSGAVNRYRQKMTCRALSDAVSSDGGEPVTRQQAVFGAQPGRGHYIALMARPESCIKGHCYEADFHAMRKDSSGTWSWKHPGMPATNRDLFGALVTDPEAAALQGSYQVCGYFRVEPQKMLPADAGTRKEPGPLPVNPALDKFRAIAGVQLEVAAIPYNPSTDAAVIRATQQTVAEDAAWERLKGSEQYLAWRVREKQALEVLPRGVVRLNDALAGAEKGGSSNNSSSGSVGARRRLLQGATDQGLLAALSLGPISIDISLRGSSHSGSGSGTSRGRRRLLVRHTAGLEGRF